MSAPIVYADTRRPLEPRELLDGFIYLSDADNRLVKGWPKPKGQLWQRVGSAASPVTHVREGNE